MVNYRDWLVCNVLMLITINFQMFNVSQLRQCDMQFMHAAAEFVTLNQLTFNIVVCPFNIELF